MWLTFRQNHFVIYVVTVWKLYMKWTCITQTNINTLTIHLTTNVKSKRWNNGMGKEQLDQQSFWFHTFFLACSSQRGLSWMTSNTGTEHWSPPGHFAVHCAYRTCLESFIMSNICSIKLKKLQNLCSSHKNIVKQ